MQISAEEAQKVLKDLVFSMWTSDECEERTDTLKMLALVDFFLPFLPLERPHIEQLFVMRLQDRRRALLAEKLAADLTWTPQVVQFLADRVRLPFSVLSHPGKTGRKSIRHLDSYPDTALAVLPMMTDEGICAQVDFEGKYPIEGAKEVGTLMTRYISRVLRPWSSQLSGTPGKSVKAAMSSVAGKLKKAVKTPSKATSGKQKSLAPPAPHLQLRVQRDRRGYEQITVSDIDSRS